MPSTRSLFQPIQRFNKPTIVIRLARISKTRRLSHVYLLIKKAIEKGILDIKLTKMPLARESHGEQ
jgi:hypothetical protein